MFATYELSVFEDLLVPHCNLLLKVASLTA